MSYSWDVMSRGYAAYAVELLKKDSPVRGMSKKKRREWIENRGMAKLAVERFFLRRKKKKFT